MHMNYEDLHYKWSFLKKYACEWIGLFDCSNAIHATIIQIKHN